jgi:hypothetical protein
LKSETLRRLQRLGPVDGQGAMPEAEMRESPAAPSVVHNIDIVEASDVVDASDVIEASDEELLVVVGIFIVELCQSSATQR